MTTEMDPLQRVWGKVREDPGAAFALYVGKRAMVIPEVRPIVPRGHLLVVSHEPVFYEDLIGQDAEEFDAALRMTIGHMKRRSGAAHGVAATLFGQRIVTAHFSAVARFEQPDALNWGPERPFAEPADLAATREFFAFETAQPGEDPGYREVADALVYFAAANAAS